MFNYFRHYIGKEVKATKDKKYKSSLEKIDKLLTSCAESHNLPLEQKTTRMKARDKKAVCKLFHSGWLVVPVDGNEVGYRDVPETPGE